LRWETHSAPEYGKRPQEIINRQVVDNCDLLVGIFWTRLGSPSGVSDSGTIEEIERVATQGKPVMLYFSQSKQDPDKINIEQLQKLRTFKEKTFPRALVESFSNQIEFRDKLAKQIEIQVRELIAEIRGDELDGLSTSSTADIQFCFADPKTEEDLSNEITIDTIFFDVADIDSLSDYELPKKKGSKKRETFLDENETIKIEEVVNKDYHREIVRYIIQQNLYRPIRFWVKNTGGIGARDVYMEFRLISDTKSFSILKRREMLSKPRPSTFGNIISSSINVYNYRNVRQNEIVEEIHSDTDNKWATVFEFNALQPQRKINPDINWLIGAEESSSIIIQVRIYADTISEPQERILKLHLKVKKVMVSAQDIIKEYLSTEHDEDD